MQRLYKLGDELKNLEKEQSLDIDQVYFKELKYENILFHYEKDNERYFSVGPVSLKIRPGKVIFIVGGNGSGKSTLLNLLTGLYPLKSGHIFLNGKRSEINACRPLFSLIPYDFHLFDRLYGLEKTDSKRVNELLKCMKLDKKVEYQSSTFSTLKLSTGQKKRMAMLVALLEDKPIYVFDEWAADQDPEFRKYFYEDLLPSLKAKGKTIIAVTHDDRYFHMADEVVKLEHGLIVKI